VPTAPGGELGGGLVEQFVEAVLVGRQEAGELAQRQGQRPATATTIRKTPSSVAMMESQTGQPRRRSMPNIGCTVTVSIRARNDRPQYRGEGLHAGDRHHRAGPAEQDDQARAATTTARRPVRTCRHGNTLRGRRGRLS
jgi:hypothetical protein